MERWCSTRVRSLSLVDGRVGVQTALSLQGVRRCRYAVRIYILPAAGRLPRPRPPLPPSHCRVRISALALLKMAMHAKSGGNLEVMGVMQVRA